MNKKGLYLPYPSLLKMACSLLILLPMMTQTAVAGGVHNGREGGLSGSSGPADEGEIQAIETQDLQGEYPSSFSIFIGQASEDVLVYLGSNPEALDYIEIVVASVSFTTNLVSAVAFGTIAARLAIVSPPTATAALEWSIQHWEFAIDADKARQQAIDSLAQHLYEAR